MDSFAPALSNAFVSVKLLVNQTVDMTTDSINFNALETTGLTPNMMNLASAMDTCQSNVTQLVSTGNTIQNTKNDIDVKVNVLAFKIDLITGNITALSQFFPIPTAPETDKYRLTTPLTIPDISGTSNDAKSKINQAPDGATSMEPLKSAPNLTVFANEIRGVVSTLQTKVGGEILKGGVGIHFVI